MKNLDSKKIVIDCRFWGLENTGIGRYTMNLVNELMNLDKTNEYFLLFKTNFYNTLSKSLNLKNNFHPILADYKHYSVQEQFLLPKLLFSLKPDLYHAVDLNIPVFWKGKLVVTIHDLTRIESVGNKVTTLPMPTYWFKYGVMKYWVMKQIVHSSNAIIVPSNFVRQNLLAKYPATNNKIQVVYEAPEEVYFQKLKKSSVSQKNDHNKDAAKEIMDKYQLKTNKYLIYTGNAYPHKNLDLLIVALLRMKQKYRPILAIACGRSVFRARIEHLVKLHQMQKWVKFLGFVPDEVLRDLYRHSLAFITPSLMEGFGLPGIEAMASGTIVLSSDRSCLPEIYGKNAVYFDPSNPADIKEKILSLLKMNSSELKNARNDNAKYAIRFTWKKTAIKTLEVYRNIH